MLRNPVLESDAESGAVNDKSADLNPIDPDLARVVSVWPTLPEGIRNAINAIIGSVSPPAGG